MENLNLQENIKQALRNNVREGEKKQISLLIDESLLRKADVISGKFKEIIGAIGGALPTTRNQLIEAAVEEYVKEAANALLLESFVNIEELLEDIKEEAIDLEEITDETTKRLAVFPAHEDGFENVFMNKNKWYSVRVVAWKASTIAYIALYRTAPYHEISHYAKVTDIQPFEGTKGRYVIYFEGPHCTKNIILDEGIVG